MHTRLRGPGLTVLLAAAVAACSPAGELSESEIKLIEATLEGDQARAIVVKASLRPYWFPPSDTSYRITTYQDSDQEIHGSGRIAVAQGRSLLSWQTVAHDSVLSATTSRSEYLTVLRKEDGRWRIYRQMFVTRQ